ncbi:MAG: hypothetical protein ACMUIG_00450 [Thermoplasmatota archaeon]
MADEKDEATTVSLEVKRSPISGSGIARVNNGVLNDLPDLVEGKTVLVTFKKKNRVLRLVADDIIHSGLISLRQKDMEKLRVREGDVVELSAMKGMESIKKRIPFFGKKEE